MTMTETRTGVTPDFAAAEFLIADAALNAATEARDAAKAAVVASFTAAGLARHNGVICTPSERRDVDDAAAIRIDAEALTVRKSSVKLVDAALLAGVIDRRQYRRLISSKPIHVVQPETIKVPKGFTEVA
jgi:hypothetical protein